MRRSEPSLRNSRKTTPSFPSGATARCGKDCSKTQNCMDSFLERLSSSGGWSHWFHEIFQVGHLLMKFQTFQTFRKANGMLQQVWLQKQTAKLTSVSVLMALRVNLNTQLALWLFIGRLIVWNFRLSGIRSSCTLTQISLFWPLLP